MRHGRIRAAAAAAVTVGAIAGVGAGTASAAMIKLPTIQKVIAAQKQAAADGSTGAVYLNAPPCPESGQLPHDPVGLVGNCGLGEFPATTAPELGPMVYWGGHVQVHPKEFIVYWGWGNTGAWKDGTCTTPVNVTEDTTNGPSTVTLPCDPDGAGKYVADFVAQMGGTQWAEVQDQYFQTKAGVQTNIDETHNVLAGMWLDGSNMDNFEKTSGSNPAGPTNTYTLMAREASLAVKHFEATGELKPADVPDSNIILLQPNGLTDPNALASGYCAFHDYTLAAAPGNTYYVDSQVTQGLQYTNMPYMDNPALINACGQQTVHTGPQGNMDSFSLALGHEIQETATDPGAEDIVTDSSGNQTYYGGWYDAADANENGDKCAYVGSFLTGPVPGGPTEAPVPGAMGTITGSKGGLFAVQSLWSDAAAGGAGYCSGSGNDLPGPLAGDPPYSGSVYVNASKRAIASGKAAKAKRAKRLRHAKRAHRTR